MRNPPAKAFESGSRIHHPVPFTREQLLHHHPIRWLRFTSHVSLNAYVRAEGKPPSKNEEDIMVRGASTGIGRGRMRENAPKTRPGS